MDGGNIIRRFDLETFVLFRSFDFLDFERLSCRERPHSPSSACPADTCPN